MQPLQKYSQEDQKKALQAAIFYLTTGDPFSGALLTELTIRYTFMVPTACIYYHPKQDNYVVELNPNYFCDMKLPQRIAVLYHEILHFTHQHLFRLPMINKEPEECRLYNIAGDMAINQLINNLPEGAVNVKEWKDNDGNPFPLHQTMEQYYELIKNGAKPGKDRKPQGTPRDGQGNESGENEGDDKGSSPRKNQGYSNVAKSNAGDNLNKYIPMDEHRWGEKDAENMTPEEREAMLQEAKKMLKRTIEKTQFGHDSCPDSIKDLLQELEVAIAKMNYKAILRACIKKTVSSVDRENTWNRKNKRYGVYAPGSTQGKLPNLNFYNDNSGSISITEQNTFFGIMDKFLHAGSTSRKCMLYLWHTKIFYAKKYKMRDKLRTEDLESGGTDVACVLDHIKRTSPDLSIILTDGYYSEVPIIPKGDIIWIISKSGNVKHPMSHVGKTIPLDGLE